MAPRDRRYRRGQKAGSAQAWATDMGFVDQSTPTTDAQPAEEFTESSSSSHGVSILKEIFPEHGRGSGGVSILKEIFPDHGAHGSGDGGSTAPNTAPKAALLHQLLGGVPSPVRALSSPARGLVSTTPLSAPALPVPPPPPLLPAPSCQPTQDTWDMPHNASAPLVEPGFGSYRERLRAGGRGALQRTMEAGLMPRSMRQDAGARAEVAPNVHNMYQQQPDTPCGTPMSQSSPMSYTSSMAPMDASPMWNTAGLVQNAEYWPTQMDQPQMPTPYPGWQAQQVVPHAQEMGPAHQPFVQPMHQQAPVNQPLQPQVSSQMPPRMAPQQTQVQQMQLPPMQMPQMHVPSASSGDATPTELDRCMAIVMPQTAQFPCDKDLMAAQLRAAADCQRYED